MYEIDHAHLKFFDTDKLSFPALTDDYTRNSIPIKGFYDAIGATNQPKVGRKVLRKSAGSWSEVTESVYPSLWNDGQVQRLPRPIKAIWVYGSNKLTGNGADPNRNVRNLTAKDAGKYKIELIVNVDPFFSGTARFSDVILPCSTTFEKYFAPTSTQYGEVVCLHGGKAVEAPGQAKNDIDIGWEYFKTWAENDSNKNALFTAYYGKCAPDENMGSDEKVLKGLWEHPNLNRPFSYEEWKRRGVHYAEKYASNYRTIPENPAEFTAVNHSTDVFIWNQEFREYPSVYPLHTPSGKVEAYCQAMVEDYEGRNFMNYDSNITLDAPLKFAGTPSGWEHRGRYVYPVPMYIPTIEGRHACDREPDAPATDVNDPVEQISSYTRHPNPMGFAGGFDYTLCNCHSMQRVHSFHNTNPIINELFKYDKDGNPAYYDQNRDNPPAEISAPAVMTPNVYEPALLNINATYADGDPIKDKDIILVESLRGKGLFSAKLTKRIQPWQITINQGSHYNPDGMSGDPNDIDRGGAISTHISTRPSRFGRGFTASDARIRITKGV
jgi:anaerobic dimethyl sulfoxide reductase subunit A